jgi:hypothetical protein
MSVLARQLLLRRCAAALSPLPARRLLPAPLTAKGGPRTLPFPAAAAMSSGAAGGGDGGGGGGGGANKAPAAPEVDALALFTGPGADHLRGQSCSVHGCSA